MAEFIEICVYNELKKDQEDKYDRILINTDEIISIARGNKGDAVIKMKNNGVFITSHSVEHTSLGSMYTTGTSYLDLYKKLAKDDN